MQDVDLVPRAERGPAIASGPNLSTVHEDLDERTYGLALVPQTVPQSRVPGFEVVEQRPHGTGRRREVASCDKLRKHRIEVDFDHPMTRERPGRTRRPS